MAHYSFWSPGSMSLVTVTTIIMNNIFQINLNIVCAVCPMVSEGLILPLGEQKRIWSDILDAQAELSLRWVHMPFCWQLNTTCILHSTN